MQPETLQIFRLPETQKITQLAGGANNRVFKLEFADREPLVYKQYFQHPNDPRPRLTSEFAFLEYAWSLGLRNIPQPIQAEPSVNGAIYSHLSGRPIQSKEITEQLIAQKVSFLLILNKQKQKALHLPKASEACFSIQNFLDVTESRIDRVRKCPVETPLEHDLKQFMANSLLPAWEKLQERTCKAALHLNLSLKKEISFEEKCVTPSDYGFHNALLHNDQLFFLDFEYAGWDDPCKTISDLFCQPRIPIPEKYLSHFAEQISTLSPNPEQFLSRLELVRPLIQMKWCCICLNLFTQVGKNRRQFSQSDEQGEKQLNLAKEQLKKIQI